MKTVSRWLRNILIFFFTSTILAVVILKYIPVYVTRTLLPPEQVASENDRNSNIKRWKVFIEIVF